MDILKLLDKSNCRRCGEKTCLAFASTIFKGRRRLEECPTIDPEVLADFNRDEPAPALDVNAERDKEAAELKKKISKMNFEDLVEKTGGTLVNGKLKISVMGKDFTVDQNGELSSQIHLHAWVSVPILYYIASGKGREVTGKWVSWRDLPGGREFEGLYNQQVLSALNQVAEDYTDLFEDMLHVFNGRQVEQVFDSDISLVLNPLPKLPVLVCYWAPEDGLKSNLRLFFDSTAVDNIGGINPLYGLTAGLGMMFVKISQTHGGKS
jgi:hypothetical protein